MEPSKQLGLDDQPPSYQVNPSYPPASGYNNAGFVGNPYGAQAPYGGQVAVVLQPPMIVAPAPLQQQVPDYLAYSIFTMLVCCLPLGIGALIYSFTTREANMAGDRSRAEQSSRMAYLLNNVSLGLGIVAYVICIILVIVNLSVLRD